MDKIKELKAEFNMPDEDELYHSIQKDFHEMEETLKERELNLLGLNRTLEELTYSVERMEETLHTERNLLGRKEQEETTLNDRLDELKSDKAALLQEVYRLETQRNSVRNAKSHPNLKDQQTMELGSKKFKYYKQLTGLRWDFSAPEGTVKGYVTNGSGRIHCFNYEAAKGEPKLQSVLWREIAKATERPEVAGTDENKDPNV